jgi:hypothetical protein
MKMKYFLPVLLLFVYLPLCAEIKINFEMIIGVRMGPADSSVEGAAHFKADRTFIIEIEFSDGVVRETGAYSYDPLNGVLILNYKGSKGIIRYNILSSNGSVKFLMVNRVAEAPPFILELLYGKE